VYVKITWAHSADDLRTLYQTELEGKLRQRYHALWLLRQRQHTIDEIAKLLGVIPGTIIRWIQWYRENGLDEIRAHRVGRAGGVKARLTLEDCALLAAYAATGLFRSIDEVRQWVEDYFGVRYTYWGMRSVLDRYHLHGVLPRPQSAQADLEIQDVWKKGG
jgi:transposase